MFHVATLYLAALNLLCGFAAAEVLETSVVIIGGGASGIAAARTLAEQDVEFLLIEALDVLGGRVQSLPLTETEHWNVGAQWIHGTQTATATEPPANNPILELATNASRGVSLSAMSWRNMTLRSLNGTTVDSVVASDWYDRMELVQAYCQEQSEDLWLQAENLTEPVGAESLDITLEACWSDFGFLPPNSSEEVEQVASALNWFAVDFEYTLEPSQLGVMWSQPRVGTGGDVHVVGSFQSVLVEAARHLPVGSVRIGQKVTNVSYNSTGVTVTTEKGLVIHAKAAISTLPLGVLQREAVAFDPPFSVARQSAINTMVMGHYAKVLAIFDSVFWGPEEVTLLAGNTTSALRLMVNRDHPNIYPGSKALEFHFAGDTARVVESLHVGDLQESLMAELEDYFGEGTPAPHTIAVTNWTHNPYSRGAFSTWPLGFKESEWMEMISSLDGVVFFAGEHTVENFGTVQGAWESGITVVTQQVLPALQQQDPVVTTAEQASVVSRASRTMLQCALLILVLPACHVLGL